MMRCKMWANGLVIVLLHLSLFADAPSPSASTSAGHEAIFQRYGQKPIDRARRAASAMFQLGSLGVPQDELFKIALYIETTGKELAASGRRFFAREETGLQHCLWRDSHSKQFYIRLDHQHLGSGYHKVVTKAVQYDAEKPQLVAHCGYFDDPKKEIHILKRLQGTRGICEFRATAMWKDPEGNEKQALLVKLYNQRSLGHVLAAKKAFSIQEKITIARDLLSGLAKMHSKGYVHCDLHSRNFLIHRESRDILSRTPTVQAALCDFGRTRTHREAQKMGTRIQASTRCNPPEAFCAKSSRINCYAVDLYALGCNLYALFHGVAPPWASKKEDFAGAQHLPDAERVAFGKALADMIRQQVGPRRAELAEKRRYQGLTLSEEMERLILQMVDADPKRRGTAARSHREMQALLTP